MAILQYETYVSPDGHIAIPPIPEYRDRKVVVRVDAEREERSGAFLEHSEGNGKTPEQDFLDFCEELAMPSLSDDEVDRIKYERLQRIAAEQARITDQTPEEWQAAVDDFTTSWKGCLKGVPHMAAKEIRAERLEKKYGQRGGTE